jgi:hypothetical protein
LNWFTRWRFSLCKFCVAISFLLLFPPAKINVFAIARHAKAQSNSSSQKTPSATGQISGHIYRADTGAPLTKTQVALLPVTGSSINITGERRFTLTNADGAYSFALVAPGAYTIAAKHDGFIGRYFDNVASPEDAQILTVGVDETLSKIDINMITAGVISGTVLDEDNQPLTSVQVEAVRVRYLRGGRRIEAPRMIGMTDDLGNFRLFRLPPGNYLVRVQTFHVNLQTGREFTRIAYYPNTMDAENAQTLKVTAGNELSGINFSVGMSAAYSIIGNIIDVTGSAGSRQYRITADRVYGGDASRPSTTSVRGTFNLQGITPGEYLLRAASTLTGPSAQMNGQPREVFGMLIARVSDGDARVNIQVSPQAEVNGRILIENSKGQSNAGILVAFWPQLPIFGSGSNTLNNMTDRNGAFKIQYLTSGNYDFGTFDAPGMYLKKAVCNGKDHTLLPLNIESGIGVSDCVLTMATDAGMIRGQVLDGEKPVPGEIVVAIPEDRELRHLDRFTVIVKTNANGEYRLLDVIPGDYLLFAVAPDESESYYDINFADRNLRDTERVSVRSSETKIAPLKPTSPQ